MRQRSRMSPDKFRTAAAADARAASWKDSRERFHTFPVPIRGARGYAFARHDGGDLYIVLAARTNVYIESFGWHPGAHAPTVGRPISERLIAGAPHTLQPRLTLALARPHVVNAASAGSCAESAEQPRKSATQ